MLQVYTEYRDGYVISNDIEFNTNTYRKMINDESKRYKKIISQVEGVEFCSDDKIISKFTGQPLSLMCISTGCKTILNIMYNPDKVISTVECGSNYSKYIYKLSGKIYMPNFLSSLHESEIGKIDIQLHNDGRVEMFDNIHDLEGWFYERKNAI